MRIRRLTSWRLMVLPLAAITVGAALTTGWGSSLASSGGAPAADPSQPDPEVTSQSISFVIAPRGDDNFQPPNACNDGNGAAATSLGQTRCTAAIFDVDSHPQGLSYSSTPCPLDVSPFGSGQRGLQFLSLKSPSSLRPCTAPGFLTAPSAAGREAVHDFPGASCKPGGCRLFMVVSQRDGDFNAPGLCSGAFYLTAPCTVAVIDTKGHKGGDTVDFSDSSCPKASNLSLPPIGDIEESCTNLPFKPADMRLTLPPDATPAPEDLTPPQPPARHSTEIADQAETLVLSPDNQFLFDPPNACSLDGLKPVNRCTAAILDVPAKGGNIQYDHHSCKLDLSGKVDPCTAAPFVASRGGKAISGFPAGVTCVRPEPAPQPNTTPQACRIYVVLTREDGDFNSGNPCGSVTGVAAACLLAVADTSDRHEGDGVALSATPCPSGSTTPDADVHDSCSAASLTAVTAPPTIKVTLPEDLVLGN